MKNKYVALRIYNNLDWRTVLQTLENNNYTWVSGDKPTSLYYDYAQGTIFINTERKTLTKDSKVTTFFDSCNYYIKVE